jgi:hypothetical protein
MNAPILDAFRQRARAAIEATLMTVLATSYGPPSMWPRDYPKGWRHPPAWPANQRPTPEEACWHDNGVRDVWFALRAALATGSSHD